MSNLSDLKLAFVDIETTGLDDNEHEIIEIAAVIYNPKTDKVINEWEKKIAPVHLETADEKALKINGFLNNPNAYTGKPKPTLIKFNSLVKDCMIVGQNIEFDLKFIRRDMSYFDIEPSFTHRNKIDLLAMAWPLVKDKELPGLGLANFCDYFGVSNAGAHGALVDCRRTYEVYRCLMNIYSTIPNK